MPTKSIYLMVSIPRRSSKKKNIKRMKWRPLASEIVLERIRSIGVLEADVYTRSATSYRCLNDVKTTLCFYGERWLKLRQIFKDEGKNWNDIVLMFDNIMKISPWWNVTSKFWWVLGGKSVVSNQDGESYKCGFFGTCATIWEIVLWWLIDKTTFLVFLMYYLKLDWNTSLKNKGVSSIKESLYFREILICKKLYMW